MERSHGRDVQIIKEKVDGEVNINIVPKTCATGAINPTPNLT